jgi:transcriptional regulator with XRE-family HTH domain
MKLTKFSENLYKREFGKTVRFFRQKKGLTIAQAAKLCGCRPQQWKRYELGNFINLRVIFRIALAFDSDPYRFSRGLFSLVDKNLKKIQHK